MDQNLRQQQLDFAKVLSAIKRPLIVSHAKPDGDAIGSILALCELLARKGASPTCVVFDELPDRYQWIDNSASLKQLGRDIREPDLDRFDAAIIVDTCTYNQLEPIAKWLRNAKCTKFAIDHHQTRDDLVDHYMIDESAAAACLILFELARECGWPITEPAAEALFIGIATDTGWFRHSNTDQRVLAACADLVGRGVNPNRLFNLLYQADKPQRVRLLGKAIESMELLQNDRLAIMQLPAAIFNEIGASPGDTEDIVNEPLRIGSVIVSALLVEQDGVIRVSLRSRAPLKPGDPDIDVAAIAAKLGGGGHRRAAGVRFKEPLSQARQSLVAHLTPHFKNR